jgi:hypothetical protein
MDWTDDAVALQTNLQNYWQGKFANGGPFFECVMVPPVTVIERVA